MSFGGGGGFGNSRGGFQNQGGGFQNQGNQNNGFSNNGSRNGPSSGGFYGGAPRGGGSNSRGGNSRGRGRGGGSRGGRGGAHGGGGIKFANICQFENSVEAHCTNGAVGALCTAAWPEGNTLFSGGMDGIVKMFDISNGSSNAQAEGNAVTALYSFGSWLFCGYVSQPTPGQDVGFVKGYNFGTGGAPEQFNFEMSKEYPAAHQSRVNTICVGGDMVFTGGGDGAVRAWSMNGNQGWRLVGTLGGTVTHQCPVTRICVFSNVVFTAGQNGEVKVWSLQGEQKSQFQAHESAITDMVGWTSGAQTVLLTCSADKSIRVWDLQQNNGIIPSGAQPVFVYPPPNLPKKPKAISCMTTVQIPNQAPMLVVGYTEGSIQLLDLPDFTDLGFLSGHQRGSEITSISLFLDANMIFVSAMDGRLSSFRFKNR